MRILVPMLAVALLLSGCAGTRAGGTAATAPAAAATPSASAVPVALTGTWTVEDAEDSTLDFSAQGAVLDHAGDRTVYAWATSGDDVLIAPAGESPVPDGIARTVGTVRTMRATASSVVLLDADGKEVLHLTSRGRAPSAPPEPTPGPSAAGSAAAVEGTWHLAGHDDAAVTLADGTWTAQGTCATRTAAGGGRGAYRVLGDGRLLVVRTLGAVSGCAVTTDLPPAGWRAVVGFGTARSFAVDGDRLTVYDGSGAPLGTLVR